LSDAFPDATNNLYTSQHALDKVPECKSINLHTLHIINQSWDHQHNNYVTTTAITVRKVASMVKFTMYRFFTLRV